MIKLHNAPWQKRAAVALMIAVTLAGCGRRDDIGDGSGNGGGNGNGGNGQNNPTDTFGITSANRLVTFNRSSPAIKSAVNITGLAANETLLGFDFRPADGTLIGLGSTGRLYTINTDGTVVAGMMLMADPNDVSAPYTGLTGTSFGVNFNPVPDRLRVVGDDGQNLRINVDTGVVITDSELNTDNITATSYSNTFPSACRTTLYYINTTTNQLLTTPNPNEANVTPLGNIAVNGATVNGFEVLTRTDGTNMGLVVLTSAGTSTLMTISLTNATLSNSQAITGLNAGETITAISMAPPNSTPTQTLGELVAVTQSNRLISFNANAPGKLCTPATRLTGLQAGDNVLGIDVRPKDGLLYAVGSSGRLYTINTSPGNSFAAVTMGPLLQAAPGTQFTGFVGNADFGFDFNPMADRLRMVSSNEQNLSIDVDQGLVTSQTMITPTNSNATAAAYDNNVAGANATTLYVIDTSKNQLFTQTPPAMGMLNSVGLLGITDDVLDSNGFDISGRTGNAVAALTVGAMNSAPILYSINLMSGAASPSVPAPAPIASSTVGGGERLRGLAYSTPPAPMMMAVTADNQLITFAPTAPQTLLDAVSISGLQGGESVVALQTQANGKLQITSDAQRIYSLDATTGAAVLSGDATVAGTNNRATMIAAGVRFSARASTSNGLAFGAATNGLGQSQLFTLDANGTPTAVGMIGPAGTSSVQAMAIRLN